MAVKLLAVAVGIGLLAWAIAANTGPHGNDSVSLSPERIACERRGAAQDPVGFDFSSCGPQRNWPQEHAALTGLIAGVSTFLIGAVLIQVQSTGRRS